MPVDIDEHPDGRFEDRFGEALRQAGGTFETDRAALVAAGAARGRRLRLRRRAAVVGGVAGVALVGLGGALLVPGGDDGTRHRSVAADPTTPEKDSGTIVSGAELLRTLEKLLPRGEFSGEQSRGTDAQLGPYAYAVYDDGKGKAAVSVSLDRIERGSEQAAQLGQCPDKALTSYDSCVTSKLPGGAVVRVFQGYEYPDRRAETKLWTADLVTAEGQHVGLSEWNAPAEKGEPVSRDEPPLSAAQLKEVVTAKAWLAAVDAIPQETRQQPQPGTSSPPGFSGKAIRSTLVSLLPKGVDVVAQGGQETEYGYVVLNDGKGKSLVQINVQPDMSDVEGQLFGSDAETLPDGTKVATSQGPGEKGGEGVVMWTADTIRTDGMRVVISAFNSGRQDTPATRKTPALTLRQLKAIATSGKWLKLQ